MDGACCADELLEIQNSNNNKPTQARIIEGMVSPFKVKRLNECVDELAAVNKWDGPAERTKVSSARIDAHQCMNRSE